MATGVRDAIASARMTPATSRNRSIAFLLYWTRGLGQIEAVINAILQARPVNPHGDAQILERRPGAEIMRPRRQATTLSATAVGAASRAIVIASALLLPCQDVS